ncbi:MAG: ribosome assembly RNA-binding protein YhbY [Acidobacteriota bacterium]
MSSLTGFQKKHLRGLAHSLQPVVRIGRGGLSDGVLAELDEALESHELIKIKLGADRDERRRISEEIGAGLDAALVGAIGRVAILFRPARDPEKRRIKVPRPRSS